MKSLADFTVAFYVTSLPLNSFINLGYIEGTPSFYLGLLVLMLPMFLFVKQLKKANLLPFLLLVPIFIGVVVHGVFYDFHIVYLFNILIFISLVFVLSQQSDNQLNYMIVLYVSSTLLFYLYCLIVGDYEISNYSERWSFANKNENDISVEILLALVSLLYLMKSSIFGNNYLFKIVLFAVVAPFFVSIIVLTGTRFGVYALLIISTSVIFLQIYNKNTSYLSYLWPMLILLSLSGVFLQSTFIERLSDFQQPEFIIYDSVNKSPFNVVVDDSSLTLGGRLSAWIFTYNLIDVETFLLGVGEEYYKSIAPSEVGSPHNYFLSIWVDSGLIGLSIILFVFGKLFFQICNSFRDFSKNEFDYLFISLTIVCFLIFMLMNVYYLKSLWFFVAVIFVLYFKKRLETDETSQ